MRDANVNIKLSDLQKVFSKLGIEGVEVREFARACLPFNCKSRVEVKTTTRKKAQIKRSAKTNAKDSELFRTLLMVVRTDEKHNLDYLKFINEKSVEYTNLSEAAIVAVDFAKTFEMTKADGMEEFIRIGVKLMRRKFALNRFKFLLVKIFEAKRIELLVQGPGLQKGATVAKEYFRQLQNETKREYTAEIPNDVFVNFIYAAEEIEKAKANIKDWISAQFERLAFMEILPEINQLHGDGAADRYIKYKFGKADKKGDKSSVKVDIGMMDAETRAYFKSIK